MIYQTGAEILRFLASESWVSLEAGQALALIFVSNHLTHSVFSTWVVVGTRILAFPIHTRFKALAILVTCTLHQLARYLRVSRSAWWTLTLCLIVGTDTHCGWRAWVVLPAGVQAGVVLTHFR